MKSGTYVIVGASLAGARAAAALREEGFDGRVVLIGEEAQAPYERPPLTKEYLRGTSPLERALVHPAEFYAEHEIELLSGARATALDLDARQVELEDGRALDYERLLLATGAAPRRISVPGIDLDAVCYLRTVADCDQLRTRLEGRPGVAVVGAGWIGMEFAASARQLGAEVTVIEPAGLPLERVLGPQLGAFYRDVHREHGVELLLGTSVEAFEGDGAVERVRTSVGGSVECALVVVGIGVAPRIELAHAAGIETDNGIVVDAALATSAPGVFAAGDVANAWHPFYGRRVRVEHWANALNQGPLAARSMLGRDAAYERLPYFYSDQFDVGMEYSGLPGPDDELLFRGDPASGEFVAFWVADGRVTAGMNVNVWDVNEHVQSLIRSRTAVDLARLRDPATPLAQLVAATT